MKLTKESVTAGIEAGLALTDPETDLLDVFRKQATGVIILRGLLEAIRTGQVALSSTVQEEKQPPADSPNDEEGKVDGA